MTQKLNKTKKDAERIQNEYNMPLQRKRALQVLKLAKAQEQEKRKRGARYRPVHGLPGNAYVLSK